MRHKWWNIIYWKFEMNSACIIPPLWHFFLYIPLFETVLFFLNFQFLRIIDLQLFSMETIVRISRWRHKWTAPYPPPPPLLGHCPKFSRFSILMPPLRFYGRTVTIQSQPLLLCRNLALKTSYWTDFGFQNSLPDVNLALKNSYRKGIRLYHYQIYYQAVHFNLKPNLT